MQMAVDRALRWSWLVVLVGCGGGLVAARPTETVRVLGVRTDAVGQTIEFDERGLVHVALHEGPSVWVEPGRVSPVVLTAGTPIVVRDPSGALASVTVAENLDRVVAVTDERQARTLVPLDHVIAVLHGAPTSPATVTAVDPPPPPPPPDPRRFATRATSVELLERVRLASCSASGARVLQDDGTVVTVPVRALRSTRVQVGDRVSALWQNGETAYAGVVLALEGRLVNVRYEDGSEEWVQPAQIVRREATATSAGACPRGGEDFAMVSRGALRRVVEVTACSGAAAVVRVPGEDTSDQIALTDLRALEVAVGARVEVLWHQSSPYAGWAGATHDGRVDVRYDDGSNEPAPLVDLRTIASDAASAPYVCLVDP